MRKEGNTHATHAYAYTYVTYTSTHTSHWQTIINCSGMSQFLKFPMKDFCDLCPTSNNALPRKRKRGFFFFSFLAFPPHRGKASYLQATSNAKKEQRLFLSLATFCSLLLSFWLYLRQKVRKNTVLTTAEKKWNNALKFAPCRPKAHMLQIMPVSESSGSIQRILEVILAT